MYFRSVVTGGMQIPSLYKCKIPVHRAPNNQQRTNRLVFITSMFAAQECSEHEMARKKIRVWCVIKDFDSKPQENKSMLHPNSCAIITGETTGVSNLIRIYTEFCKIPLKKPCAWHLGIACIIYLEPLLGTFRNLVEPSLGTWRRPLVPQKSLGFPHKGSTV